MGPTRCAWTVLCFACTSASAQVPTNVNDCTLLPDPVALRRCVDGFGRDNTLPTLPQQPSQPEASDAARREPLVKAAPVPPVSRPASDDWLHDISPLAKPDRSGSNAIKLND